MKIVFDIGGTNLRVAEAKKDALGKVEKILTPSDPRKGTDAIVALARKIAGTEKITAVIGGMAGTFKSSGAIFNSPHLPAWNGFDLARALKKRLKAPVTLANDAMMAGLGEVVYGAGKKADIVAYICIGTGLGGARFVNKKPDLNAYGFEPGRMILNDGKALGWHAAGAGLAQKYGKPAKDLSSGVFTKQTPLVARQLYNIMMLWSPDVLVLGGSLTSGKYGYKIGSIRKEINKLPRVFAKTPRIVTSELGDKNGLYGAVAYTRNKR